MNEVKQVSKVVMLMTSEIVTLALAGALVLMFVPKSWMLSMGLV